ncbi:MAG TPA: response regulator [Candidatus Baltobacteraceae bacterium]|nr:response regulator [Candidatus Baltobacteraceae bacterium]
MGQFVLIVDDQPEIDVGLPDGSGLEILRATRQPRTAVILLTAHAEEVDRIIGVELGADDYVTKPFSPREVVARVRAVLRRREDSAREASEKRGVSAPHPYATP